MKAEAEIRRTQRRPLLTFWNIPLREKEDDVGGKREMKGALKRCMTAYMDRFSLVASRAPQFRTWRSPHLTWVIRTSSGPIYI
jgi:hypothetical protein